MSLISHNELCELVEQGVINAHPDNINGASIDLTLHDVIMIEDTPARYSNVVSLANKENIATKEIVMDEGGYVLKPGEFILASTVEFFDLPNNISAEYKLKSSMARNGLEHLNAGFADAGWNGSRLTLEFKNMTQNHELLIKPGMKSGQIIFFKHKPVPDHASYASRGQYNGQQQVTASKGVR